MGGNNKFGQANYRLSHKTVHAHFQTVLNFNPRCLKDKNIDQQAYKKKSEVVESFEGSRGLFLIRKYIFNASSKKFIKGLMNLQKPLLFYKSSNKTILILNP